MAESWTIDDLYRKLDEFEADLRAAELRDASVRTYVDRSRYFVRWLDGDYTPTGPIR